MSGPAETADSTLESISFADLRDLLLQIFLRAGTSRRVAEVLAENCAACERDGCHSHGIFRIPGYVASLRSGWVDGRAEPVTEKVGPSFLRIDARNGFAQSALASARHGILSMLEETGVAVVAIRNSHHFSALWPDLEPLALKGYLGLAMVTGGTAVVPPGGTRRVFGTNPIAFATPVRGADPLIFDFATSAMSHGDVSIAARSGRRVPLGTGVDGQGNLTDDPSRILNEGGILPFGGHKGTALSMMVEILASGLTGGQFASQVDLTGHPGAETQRTGQLLLLFDGARGGNEAFADRVGAFLDSVRAAGMERLPSERRYAQRREAEAAGIGLSASDLHRLHGYASA